MTRSSACSEPEVIRISSAVQAMPAVALELLREEFAQRPVALRAAGKAVGRKVPAFAREHVGRRLEQPIERNMIGVVVAAGEIVLGEAGPLGGRRRQPGCQQWREIE